MNQPGFDWNAEVSQPVSGSTPLARHCSATGAQVASVTAGSKMAKLLTLFSQHRRLTLNETATLIGIQDHSLCSTWNRVKAVMGWIEETGEVKRVTYSHGRVTSQAYHRLSEKGRQAAFDLLKFKVSGIEARS